MSVWCVYLEILEEFSCLFERLFGSYDVNTNKMNTSYVQNSALWFYGYNEVSTMTLKKTVSIIFVCIVLLVFIVSIYHLTYTLTHHMYITTNNRVP